MLNIERISGYIPRPPDHRLRQLRWPQAHYMARSPDANQSPQNKLTLRPLLVPASSYRTGWWIVRRAASFFLTPNRMATVAARTRTHMPTTTARSRGCDGGSSPTRPRTVAVAAPARTPVRRRRPTSGHNVQGFLEKLARPQCPLSRCHCSTATWAVSTAPKV
jgi:hypothetical protein